MNLILVAVSILTAAPTYHAELLQLHNAVRAQQKLSPLTNNELLAKAAQAHADHMAATGKFAHQGIGDGTIDSRIDDAGYDWSRVGENIAWAGPVQGKDVAADSRGIMKVWMNSPPHRKQLLSDYQQVGFGRAIAADGKVYWVACFGNPAK